jgi:hypothetical protein
MNFEQFKKNISVGIDIGDALGIYTVQEIDIDSIQVKDIKDGHVYYICSDTENGFRLHQSVSWAGRAKYYHTDYRIILQ